ncbi:MAG: rod shape-determining protein MreC [bacterium]
MSLQRKDKILISIAISIALIIFHNLGILTPLENSARFVFTPLQKIFYLSGVKIKEIYANSTIQNKEKDDLIKENIYLKDQLEKLKVENINAKILENENKGLKELLSFTQSKKLNFIASLVIGKVINAGNFLIIDKGLKDKVSESLSVINQKGMIIGKTFECTEVTCNVILLNDNQSRIAASILGHTEANGVVEGEYGLSMKMNLIPQHIEIAQKDIIVTSGLEKDIPYGLIIGEVNNVEKKEGELFQSANIQPLFPLDGAHIVSVVLME